MKNVIVAKQTIPVANVRRANTKRARPVPIVPPVAINAPPSKPVRTKCAVVKNFPVTTLKRVTAQVALVLPMYSWTVLPNVWTPPTNKTHNW
jgi:hypothetical protein